jgi:uncharacterized coiled-coil protein SlyX
VLRLFHSIFGATSERGRYSEELVQAAIERAVAITDARLSALSGYQKKLRPAVIRAIDHVVDLVDALPPPIDVATAGYGADHRLIAFFASGEHMRQVINADRDLADFAVNQAGAAEQIFALLLMEKREKTVFGMDLEGEVLKREVAQVTVNFAGHRLVDPATQEGETRRLLKRRAFDHLLTLALGRIAAAREERTDLQRQHVLLRNKLKSLESGHWSFGASHDDNPGDRASLEARVEEIETQLRAQVADTGTLNAHLATLIDVLARAEEQLKASRVNLIVDRMGIKRQQITDTAPELVLNELTSADGRSLIMSLVSIPRGEYQPRRTLFSEGQRFLG